MAEYLKLAKKKPPPKKPMPRKHLALQHPKLPKYVKTALLEGFQ